MRKGELSYSPSEEVFIIFGPEVADPPQRDCSIDLFGPAQDPPVLDAESHALLHFLVVGRHLRLFRKIVIERTQLPKVDHIIIR